MNKLKKILSKKIKLSLSTYLTFLMAIVILCMTSIIMFLVIVNIKNLVGEYELDVNRTQNHLATLIAKTLKDDILNTNLDSTKKLLNFYRANNIFSYLYVKDNKTKSIVLGGDDFNNFVKLPLLETKQMNIVVGKYTIYYGISSIDKLEKFRSSFLELVYSALFLILLIGVLISVMFSSVVSKPLKDISKAAKKITDGEFDIQIKKSNFAEIDDLIFSCNEMAFQLNELYSSLELKVKERTIALEAANNQLKETQAMMVHSEKMRSLGELVAGIAHEINNPINFIHGNIMILQNYTKDIFKLIEMYETNEGSISEETKEEIKDYKKQIDLEFIKDDINDLIKSCIEGTERTKNIVLDLKNFSRMEAMVLTQFDIPKEIDTTLNILNNKYKNRITVIKNYEQDLPKIEAYGGQLNQVFMNILDNAQDAMPQGGTLTINALKVNDNVKIEFIDTGLGISQENIGKIFDPFFTTKAVGKGTGLGMSISYRVINDHNGTINVESEIGVGTKFTIVLPISYSPKTNEIEEVELLDVLQLKDGIE